MECSTHAISTFAGSLSFIKKVYPNVETDLVESAKGVTFDEAFEKNYTLSDSGIAKIIKLRVPNSSQNKGKSAGFRVIYFITKRTNLVVFLNIFSKVGKGGKDNVPKSEIKEYLETYKSEQRSASLLKIDLTTFQF
ncbi:MAG: hypothetical protein LBP34_00605 [Flavobacteriaceae bacterium]|jgi:mRNA-degrading endonuclease RelE of RelBE toxin-antitoxin system|nr:hypothetical protein [Flavobacteriaceae bacterium]